MEIEQLKEFLETSRLVTLTGTGGVGKTRLAIQVGAEVKGQYPDGVWLLELAALPKLSDSNLVVQTVATSLNVREVAGEALAQTIARYLRPKTVLLVLDNCEHLAAACAALATDLLKSCPNIRIVATSRERLNIPGETVFHIPSLSTPGPEIVLPIERLSTFGAIKLFLDRAVAVHHSFKITSENASAVAQVCHQLDGIPLAIELAAARVRSMSVEEIGAKLHNRFRLLKGGSQTALPRQQTLYAAIDWSYGLLSEEEKSLFCRLSVFAGGWTLSAAEAICVGIKGIEDWEVLDLLTALTDKSLVTATTESDSTRYNLLETLRQFAWGQLAERGEAEAAGSQAAAWFLGLAEKAEPQLTGPDQVAWLSRLETEHANLRASLSWFEPRAEGAGAGLRLSGALSQFWSVRGHFTEGRQWLERALNKTRGGTMAWETSVVRGRVLQQAAFLAYQQSDFAAVRAILEEGLTIQRRLHAQQDSAESPKNLESVAPAEDDISVVRALLEESLTIQRQSGTPQEIANMLFHLGTLAERQGNLDAAWALLGESLTLFRQLDNQAGLANLLDILGIVASHQGNPPGARGFHEESLTIRRQLGNLQGIASSLGNLGSVAFQEHDFIRAQLLHEESLTIERELKNKQGIATALEGLGLIACQRNDSARARECHRESLMIRWGLVDRWGIAQSLEGMAAVAIGQDQSSRAAYLLGAASFLRKTIGSPLPSAQQRKVDGQVTSVSVALGKEVFAWAFRGGRAMTLEQAVEYALSEE